RVFTEAELRVLATTPGDRAAAALDAGDLAKAGQIAAMSVNTHGPCPHVVDTGFVVKRLRAA
ncbi:hypothetical protein, partial [Mycolicibacterium goodii]